MNNTHIQDIMAVLRKGGIPEGEVYAIVSAVFAMGEASEDVQKKYGQMATSICCRMVGEIEGTETHSNE